MVPAIVLILIVILPLLLGLVKVRQSERIVTFQFQIYRLLPSIYQHIPTSIWKMCPEFYVKAVSKPKNYYHMSESQTTGTVMTVGNKMFGTNWKPNDQQDVTGLDIMAESSSIRHSGKKQWGNGIRRDCQGDY